MLIYGYRLCEKKSTTRTTTGETDMRTAERTYVRVWLHMQLYYYRLNYYGLSDTLRSEDVVYNMHVY